MNYSVWKLSFEKTVTFTRAVVQLWDEKKRCAISFDLELPIKARNEKDFAKWYKRICPLENQKLVSVSHLHFFKRKYEIPYDDLIQYGKEIVEEN